MSSLSDRDLAVVREALEELRQAPPPRDLAPVGCVIGLPGVVLLLVVPFLGHRLGLGAGASTGVLVVGLGLLVLGLVIWFSAPTFTRGHAVAAAEAALRRLEAWDPERGDREEALRAATLLVRHGYAIYGPRHTLAFDPVEARRRLGPMLVLVEAVEEVLVSEGGAYPLFTLEDEAAAPGD